jgi:hypothetical protein
MNGTAWPLPAALPSASRLFHFGCIIKRAGLFIASGDAGRVYASGAAQQWYFFAL